MYRIIILNINIELFQNAFYHAHYWNGLLHLSVALVVISQEYKNFHMHSYDLSLLLTAHISFKASLCTTFSNALFTQMLARIVANWPLLLEYSATITTSAVQVVAASSW